MNSGLSILKQLHHPQHGETGACKVHRLYISCTKYKISLEKRRAAGGRLHSLILHKDSCIIYLISAFSPSHVFALDSNIVPPKCQFSCLTLKRLDFVDLGYHSGHSERCCLLMLALQVEHIKCEEPHGPCGFHHVPGTYGLFCPC